MINLTGSQIYFIWRENIYNEWYQKKMLDAKENLKDAQLRQRDDEEDKALVCHLIWWNYLKLINEKLYFSKGIDCQIGKISNWIQKVDGKKRRLHPEEEGENSGWQEGAGREETKRKRSEAHGQQGFWAVAYNQSR